MPLYRKKPITIEAIQYTGENAGEILNFITGNPIEKIVVVSPNRKIIIETPEGQMAASKNDFIVRGYSKEVGIHFWPVKPDYFEENYEKIT